MPDTCDRTYPLDPLTAEDPCEECGRDERKHEIGPRLDNQARHDAMNAAGLRKQAAILHKRWLR